MQIYVGCRYSQLTSQLLAVNHSPGDPERLAQQVFCNGEIARFEGLANACTADTLAIDLHGTGFQHLKTVIPAP